MRILSTYRPTAAVTLILLFVLASRAVTAQDVTNSTNIYIPEGLEIHLGNFTNSGFIQNQGNVFIMGNWRNTNVYQGIGTIILNGTGEQNFFNNTNAVNRLSINAIGPIRITDKLPVTNRFDLLSGIVFISDNDAIQMAPTAVVGGGSAISYVDGAFTHEGTGYKTFPIGKNGNYHPVDLQNITGINPVTEIEVQEDLPAVNAPPAVSLYSKIYWQRRTVSGTYIGSPVVLGSQIPDNQTNRYVIEILQADDLSSAFSALGNATVSFGDELDKVSTDNLLTGNIFVLGETIPPGGIPGQFYLSTSLSPRATSLDNRVVKVFGNQLAADNFQILVYNRWGLVIYENTSLEYMIQTGWDGRHKGTGDLLPAGAYPFVLKGQTTTGEQLQKKGIITVIN